MEAFESLYRRHARRLFLFLAARIAQNDIEDAQQVIWQKVWQHVPRQFSGGNFRAWLHQIARNEIIDRHRKKQSAHLEEPGGLADPNPTDPGNRLLEHERMQKLQDCLKRLDGQLSVVVRRRLSGASYETICQEIGVDAARAHKMFHRAKTELTDCVQQAGR